MTNISPEELAMRHGREKTMSFIARAMLIAFIGLLAFAMFVLPNDAQFTRVKELIGFVTPILGVVVGFYFNKTATEPRVEKAEADARAATEAKNESDVKAGRAKRSLGILANAAEPFAQYLPKGVQLDENADNSNTVRLREALDNARKTETELDG